MNAPRLRALRSTLEAALHQIDAELGEPEEGAEFVGTVGIKCPDCGNTEVQRLGTMGGPVSYSCPCGKIFEIGGQG